MSHMHIGKSRNHQIIVVVVVIIITFTAVLLTPIRLLQLGSWTIAGHFSSFASIIITFVCDIYTDAVCVIYHQVFHEHILRAHKQSTL